MWNTIFILTYLCFFIGIVGCFLPILPGLVFVWLGVVINKLFLGGDSVSWLYLGVISVIVLLAHGLDFLLTWWGVKRFGGSWKAVVGALVGMVLGVFLFTPIIGLIVGPFLGAIGAELLTGKRLRQASKAGLGTLVATVIAFFGKLIIGMLIILSFFLALPRDTLQSEAVSAPLHSLHVQPAAE